MSRSTHVRVFSARRPNGSSIAFLRALPPAEQFVAVGASRYEANDVQLFRRWLTRELLARELGIDPRDVEIDRTCECCGDQYHGRPTLNGVRHGAASFSCSSAGDTVMVAIAPDSVVGLDVERVRPVPNEMLDVACSSEERAELLALSHFSRAQAFIDLWVRKEAILKAEGRGIVGATDVLTDAQCGRTWHITLIPAPDGHAAAIATNAPATITNARVLTMPSGAHEVPELLVRSTELVHSTDRRAV